MESQKRGCRDSSRRGFSGISKDKSQLNYACGSSDGDKQGIDQQHTGYIRPHISAVEIKFIETVLLNKLVMHTTTAGHIECF